MRANTLRPSNERPGTLSAVPARSINRPRFGQRTAALTGLFTAGGMASIGSADGLAGPLGAAYTTAG